MPETEHVLQVVARLKTNRKKMTTTIVLPEEILEESGEIMADFLKGLRGSVRGSFDRLSPDVGYWISRAVIAEREAFTWTLTQGKFDTNPEWGQLGYKVGDEITEYMYFGSMELDKNFFEKEEE